MNALKYIIPGAFLLVGIVFTLLWFGVIPGLRGGDGPVITRAELTMWGVEEDKAVIDGILDVFKEQNPGIKVEFVKKSSDTYEQELLRAFAAGTGPDVFNVHHTWLSKYKDILASAPADIFPISEFQSSFVDVARQDFVSDGLVFGVPLYVDTLALYYNTSLFNSAGIVFPPGDWDEFVSDARRLTKRRQAGDILISGAALGGGKNVRSAGDLLAMLMLQHGASMVRKDNTIDFGQGVASGGKTPAETAFEFYTSFARQASPNYSWPGTGKESSEDLFAQDRVGMMLGYADARERITKKQPLLRFDVAPAPQVKGSVFRRDYANYFGWGVYKNSPNTRAAWQLLHYMTGADINWYYLTETKRPAAQKQLIAEQQKDPLMKAFADQALSAVSWPQRDEKVVREVFTEMIETQITTDRPFRQTLDAGAAKMNAEFRKLSP